MKQFFAIPDHDYVKANWKMIAGMEWPSNLSLKMLSNTA